MFQELPIDRLAAALYLVWMLVSTYLLIDRKQLELNVFTSLAKNIITTVLLVVSGFYGQLLTGTHYIPQIFVFSMTVYSIIKSFKNHGTVEEYTAGAFSTAISFAIMMGILYSGGFFLPFHTN